ncbi:MAG: radical SAM family heme chaperone HemW [Pseudomonadota bacterium]
MTTLPWGLYIHWPFCVSKCPYCDFNSHVRESVDQARWRAALVKEIASAGARAGKPTLKSIFFGGGTPSLMPPETVAAAIAAARRHFQASPEIEITLEANPSTVEASRFAALKDAGINRLSMGIQSFDDEALRFLGRAHNAQEARTAIQAATETFDRVSFDLIYALPDQSAQHWRGQLAEALGFGTTHLSLYQLTIEPNTGFQGQVARGVFTPMDDDTAADLFELTQERLQAAGMPAYETSNHAAPGQECEHNLIYWRGQPYAAVGPGAHGRWLGAQGWQATRCHNKPERWLEAVERDGHGVDEQTVITPQERAEEMLMMGLRLAEGINLSWIETASGADIARQVNAGAAQQLSRDGWLQQDNNRLALTSKARPVANSVLAQLLV